MSRTLLAGAAFAVVVPAAGVGAYLLGDEHAAHDPRHGLQQLDLLYLDEPAPGVTATGRPQVLVFCTGCALPQVRGATVTRVTDPDLAARYALSGATGYALVDSSGRVRYRTYDPFPAAHRAEVQTLVDGLP